MQAGIQKQVAAGTFAKTPLIHILMYCYDRTLSGVLQIQPSDGSEPVRIDFEQGSPVALSAKGSNAQVLARWCDDYVSSYQFFEALHDKEIRRTRLDPLMIVAQYIRGARESAGLDQWVQAAVHKWHETPLRIKPSDRFARMQFNDHERKLVDLLRAQPMSIFQLSKVSGLPRPAVERTIYMLSMFKLVEAFARRAPTPTPKVFPVAKAELPIDDLDLPLLDSAEPPQSANEKEAQNEQVGPHIPERLMPRWKEIEEAYGELHKRSYFEWLGVAQDASTELIKQAFLDKVKQWHPDRLPKELAELKEKVAEIFFQITQAHEVLTDPVKRKAYIDRRQDLMQRGASDSDQQRIMNALQADQAYRKAEFLLKTQDIVNARAQIEEALRLDPEPALYYGLYGWVLFHLTPLTEQLLNEALTAIDLAIRKQPRYEMAHYYRGCVLKRMGQTEEATAAFQRALELQPHLIEAQREVRLAQLRKASAAQVAEKPSDASRKILEKAPLLAGVPGVIKRLFRSTKG